MRKKTMIAAAIAGSAVITALVAGPGVAAVVQGGQNGQHQQSGQAQPTNGNARGTGGQAGGSSMGHGKAGGQGQGQGSGRGSGSGPDAGSTSTGTMTDEQRAELVYMAEEELLAHDLYTTFAGLYGTPVFSRVANSESKHLEAVRNLMDRYGVTDPTVDHTAGVFSDDSLQKLYDELLAQGKASQEGAFAVGRTVEKTDIQSLATSAENATTAPDAKTAFTRLLEASQHHLTAFGG
ncbi:DUF2202 domain-containing protein [Arthrobacter sp. AL08]|uniref:ferritin-like domain-containing protein n=1 Tax=unclassified Arthrobacter TaxID=235627 RepID=UPI00249C5A2F|nr:MULTISPECIES: DUF2202 domain-containing protein [unclassified Arthrobacter]MDI3240858.1 DUF2202 domain-containing protein [Arthrobacter sp. AL05]MDI3277166.1 DUF2202 domain-containing protein [Arthrobacter sp. AL08]